MRGMLLWMECGNRTEVGWKQGCRTRGACWWYSLCAFRSALIPDVAPDPLAHTNFSSSYISMLVSPIFSKYSPSMILLAIQKVLVKQDWAGATRRMDVRNDHQSCYVPKAIYCDPYFRNHLDLAGSLHRLILYFLPLIFRAILRWCEFHSSAAKSLHGLHLKAGHSCPRAAWHSFLWAQIRPSFSSFFHSEGFLRSKSGQQQAEI